MENKAYQYLPYACLPFVELGHKSSIQMGPITFWPASQLATFTPENSHSPLESYLKSIVQVKTRTETDSQLVNTVKIPLDGTTCVSIDNTVNNDKKEMLLIDSLYLLYFACTFRNLYYSNEIPSFNSFRKMIPFSYEFIRLEDYWKDLHITENAREETVCIHLVDMEICHSFGKILTTIYGNDLQIDQKTRDDYKRMIRAIRYLIDRFFQRFVNLFKKGITFSEVIFEPEDMIFLTTSFETLFDIDDKQATSDFKHKLRSLLHLKFSRPVEIFWKWVDNFYEIKRQIVHCGQNPDPSFKFNPNFEVSHIVLGIKLFIYSVHLLLHKYQLISDKTTDSFSPIDFKWIHPEEVLLFFWTEAYLLKKLELLLSQVFEKDNKNEEIFSDIHFLSNLFVSLQERYSNNSKIEGIKFIPSDIKDIETSIDKIKQFYQKASEQDLLVKLFNERFIHLIT